MNCWEFMQCSKPTRQSCPAHPERGLDCWKVTGTKCSGGRIEASTLAEKINHCKQCDFYRGYANKY